MAAALRALGVAVDDTGSDWQVTGGPLHADGARVDVGNAGTVARFVPPVAALATGPVHLDGDPRMRERPLGPLLEALRSLGVEIDDERRAALPLTIHGTGRVTGGSVRLDASESSQLISGLLLAAPRYDDGVTVHHVGPPVPSTPHLAMTVDALRRAGASVDDSEPDVWRVDPGELRARTWDIEPDLSSAAPFLAAAVVTGGRVTVERWPESSTQPGAELPDVFTRMGAHVERAPGRLTVQGPDAVTGIDVDLHDIGELTPVLAAVAAVARTPSRLSGVAHLRRHETDRLAALRTELQRLGGEVSETADGLEIRPAELHGGTVQTYDDHRIAMAAAVLGLVVPDVEVENIATTAKTLPDFPERWVQMLGSAVRS
jgi:3-phosphoshikimate 1-carboxyvinyltransferase